MPAYLYNAPAGFPGGVSRPDVSEVQPAMLIAASSVYAQAFGRAMKYATGGIQQFNGGAETKASFAGVLVASIPAIPASSDSDSSIDDFGVPNPDQPQGLMTKGYCVVKCTAGTPARGGTVYVRIVSATDRPIGAFEASSDSSNSFALDKNQAEWASDGVDANGMAELRLIAN